MADHAIRPGNSGIQSSPIYGLVSPSDSIDLPYITRGVYVGIAGNITVSLPNSASTVIFTAVPAGTILPIQTTRVYLNGTTAGAIVALY